MDAKEGGRESWRDEGMNFSSKTGCSLWADTAGWAAVSLSFDLTEVLELHGPHGSDVGWLAPRCALWAGLAAGPSSSGMAS